MIKNQANLYQFSIVDAGGAGITGLTVTIKLRKDSGSFATATNAVSEVDTTNAPGLYAITLTASECNCDVLTIQATVPDGANPVVVDTYYLEPANSGITAQEVWQYNTRTLSDTPITASDIWTYSNRSLTVAPSSLTAQQVWEYNGGRTITNTIPTVAEIQSGLATTANITALQTHGDTAWATITGFATSVQANDIKSALNVLHAGMLNWAVNATTLTIYSDTATVLATYTITRDTEGNIIKLEPNASNE